MGRFVKGDVVRPNRLFIAEANIILYRAGVLTSSRVNEVVEKIVQIVTA